LSVAPLAIGITCYPTFGGSGIIATELGESLARRGHQVHFICSDVPSRFPRFVDNLFFHGVEVVDYPLFEHSPYPLALASKMVEVSTYAKLDLLHVHYAIPHATSAYLARQILGSRAPKVVTTLHGTDITLVGSDRSFLPITRFSILESDGVTVPSAYLRRATQEKLQIPESFPIELIPNFVDSELFAPVPSGEPRRWRPPGASDSEPWVLIHSSNFRPLKRVGDVVRVFESVRRQVPARLVLIGDGPERSRVEALVRDLGLSAEVCFLGRQLEFAEVLRDADVFLLPSETESFGLAALEALSAGVPVVASDVGGLSEVVAEGETGFLCPLGDVQAMAERVLLLCRDPKLHARMSEAARAQVLARWQREPAVERYEAYYRRVLGG
jgi:N-acetyl-alpha-D-glucosaminyl L-malate synthase BshA